MAFVISKNLHRRQLTPSQASMCAARARDYYDEQAKERMKVRKGNQPGATKENLPDLPTGQARDAVGKVFGVSGKTVDYASKVLKEAIPEVVQAVEEGRMAVSAAAILASEPRRCAPLGRGTTTTSRRRNGRSESRLFLFRKICLNRKARTTFVIRLENRGLAVEEFLDFTTTIVKIVF